MKSYWSVEHGGPHYGVFIKKLERVLKIRAIDIERERFVLDGMHREHADFFVEHACNSWPELVMSILEVSRQIRCNWMLNIGNGGMSAYTRRSFVGLPGEDQLPFSDLLCLKWEIRNDQCYKRFKFFRT